MDSTFSGQHHFVFNKSIEHLTETVIAQHTPGGLYFDTKACRDIVPITLQPGEGTFTLQNNTVSFPVVTVVQHEQLMVSCVCNEDTKRLCIHEAQVLAAIVTREELLIFFHKELRHRKLKIYATDYGLEHEADPDQFFAVTYHNKRLLFTTLLPALLPVTRESMAAMQEMISPADNALAAPIYNADGKICVVFRQHKYYKNLCIELYAAATAKDGKIKNPLTAISPSELIWKSEEPAQIQFFNGISWFQSIASNVKQEINHVALRAIFRNPCSYDFYYHNSDISENITATSLVPVRTSIFRGELMLTVDRAAHFYSLSGNIIINEISIPLNNLDTRFTSCILVNDALYLLNRPQLAGVIRLFHNKPAPLLIHSSRFEQFRMQLLNGLEDKVRIVYSYIPSATAQQLEEQGFNTKPDLFLYLSDAGRHVLLTPVIRYNDVEIPVRTKRQVYSSDEKGHQFMVQRDDETEIKFTALLLQQHADFEDQLEYDLPHFYLDRSEFLSEDWFLNAFEEWSSHGIVVLGFNELEGNKLNPHKAKVDIKVRSGLNWFNAEVQVKFGRKKASLKQVERAIRNKSRYIQLDDGTQGILPAAWLEKFAAYFSNGEITGEKTIHIPKISFAVLEELYGQEVLEEDVQQELKQYRKKLAEIYTVKDIEAPAGLHATLRPYQLQGLNWLNFLDEFNFGGCLADDMGLGKSMQIIAFMLSQRAKTKHNTNLLVVPATLIFNWQKEIEQFAPSLKVHTIYGTDRIKSIQDFDRYEVLLTSYGTLLSDISFLKEYQFNYIFLDESQNIKNPETQRYKAVRQLQSRNKITITGTPVENNTFDLYGQLSFACPGLLGSRQQFKDIYSTPIDVFKRSKRAAELQEKIRPFVLRRTKEQVATDLPDKTEMVLYCEMGVAQRTMYDAYEKEFRDYISAINGDELIKKQVHVLKGLTRLRQVCDAPALPADNQRHDIPSAKIEVLMEQLAAKSPKHKILVFSQFVTMLDLIKAHLDKAGIRSVSLTGSTRDRGAVVHSFRNDPAVRVMLISLKAGGTGLNLVEADYVYLVDPWWNPAVENQAIDRVHRIGQKKNIIAVRLICPGTVEENIMKMQESKKTLTSELIRADGTTLRSLNKQELLRILNNSTPEKV